MNGGTAEMSKRTHLWLRVTAIVVIAAAAWLPRSPASASARSGSSAGSATTAEARTIHASIAR
jgi:hypothetical protein